MGAAELIFRDSLSSSLPNTNVVGDYRSNATAKELLLDSSSELRNIDVSDLTVRLVEGVERYPQIGRLRTAINLDVHHAIDPDFILHEKKEIF